MVLLPADFIRSKRLQREQDQKERDEKQRDIGKEQGRAEATQEFLRWNARRLEAERRGFEFTEPMPGENIGLAR